MVSQMILKHVQETGRVGRDEKTNAAAILYPTKHDMQFVDENMKAYINNTSVKENYFSNFFLYNENLYDSKVPCRCCDLCAINCKCDQCIRIE